MKKLLFFILFSLILITNSLAAGQAEICYIEPTNAVSSGVQYYNAYWVSTNAVNLNSIQWIGGATVGTTNIVISTNIPSPVYIYLTSNGANGRSPYSLPCLYDINALPLLPVVATNNPITVNPMLPPTLITIKRISN